MVRRFVCRPFPFVRYRSRDRFHWGKKSVWSEKLIHKFYRDNSNGLSSSLNRKSMDRWIDSWNFRFQLRPITYPSSNENGRNEQRSETNLSRLEKEKGRANTAALNKRYPPAVSFKYNRPSSVQRSCGAISLITQM